MLACLNEKLNSPSPIFRLPVGKYVGRRWVLSSSLPFVGVSQKNAEWLVAVDVVHVLVVVVGGGDGGSGVPLTCMVQASVRVQCYCGSTLLLLQ